MPFEVSLFNIAIGITLCFAFVNGFHDGGNVIATTICSRSMHPVRALVVAALAEFCGPLVLGTAVAYTMFGSVLQTHLVDSITQTAVYTMIIGAVGGAITWNIVTWVFGVPSSSSHALIGGIVGAGMVALGSDGPAWGPLVTAVLLPLLVSPVIGIVGGFLIFSVIKALFAGAPRSVGRLFEGLQRPSMIFLAASQGSNDAQKSMGVIALVLAAGSGSSHMELEVPEWVVMSCAAALAIGLSTGGWRMVKSVGYGICRMEPVHSFTSQLTATSILLAASLTGAPVSTTQVVSSSVIGVGASRRFTSVRWSNAANIAYAWFLTVPVAAALGAAVCWSLARLVGQ